MIKVKDGKLQAELLDNKGTLSNKIIEQYDYIELKNDFVEIVDILSTNMLVHAMYQEALKYEITEDLEFKIFIDENVKDYTLSYDLATDYSYISTTNTSVITLDRKAYDKSIELCTNLLKKVKASYDKLNEVEKFIIKSLEFDNPPETDEELMDRLMTYKNGYYLSKKSAYIKMAIQLNIKNVKKMESDDFLKNMLADRCIVTISNNK
ncbi:unknown [Clostridium sp. CAG:1000]|nr:unknown [Clostridium sp. CAG:1000]